MALKKWIVMFFYSSTLYAQTMTCPSLQEIRTGHFHGWLPLYQEGEELASDADVQAFQQTIHSFTHARWDKDYLESGHCFYQGDDNIILAHDAWRPEKNTFWKWIKPAALAECASASVGDCEFIL